MFLELFLFAKKMKFLTKQGRDSLYFQVLPWHFYFMRGHSLVELTELTVLLVLRYIVPVHIYVSMSVYNHAIRPCHPSHSMPLINDTCYENA